MYMKMKSRNVNFLYVLWILTVWIRFVPASKLIRNSNSQSCLQHSDTTSTSCVPLSQTTCPVNRFTDVPKSIEWNIIPTNPSVALNSTNSTDVFIGSSDNKICLATSSNGVQVCPCDQSISQKWKINNNTLMSNANVGKCLAIMGNQFVLNTCQTGVDSMSWEPYHVAPNAVNFYPSTLFMNNYTQLTMDTYTFQKLPSSMFSSPFSIEIPPGFQFIIDHGNNNLITYNSDMANLPPINDKTSTIIIKIKPGMIIYERENYFGASEYFDVGTLVSTPQSVGSVMIPTNSRVISKFSGKNLALFEPIHSFTGVLTESNQISLGSLDISQSTCKDECTSGGVCSTNNVCVCKPGFTGPRCDQCAPGFWGPTCLACSLTCKGSANNSQMTCDDGLFGTGKCKCATGFNGTDCNTCAPGFFGPNCTPCNCGNGVCDNQGKCICNAGWDQNTNCTAPKSGYFLSGNDAKACAIGCATCNSQKCTFCLAGLNFATDKPTQCVPQNNVACPDGQFPDGNNGNACTPCNTNCATCFGPGPDQCLKCATPKFYLEGQCVTPSANGKCISPPGNQAFVANAAQGICNACPSACLDCSLANPGDLNNPSGSGAVQCSSCLPGYVLDNGNCVKTCPPGKVVDPNNNLNCIVCNSACATCSGPSASECLSCSASNQFALNGICSSTSCPSSYFTQNTTCIKCHPDCTECSGPGFNQCKKCPSTRPILTSTSESQCVESCSDGNYADSTGKCQKCHSDCSSCVGSSSNQCLGCADQSKVLINGTCSGTCPAGSKMIIAERLCYNLQTNTIISPNSIPISNTTQSSGLDWWMILLIILSIITFIVLILMLIRCIAVKKRVAKTTEFGENLDSNNVIRNMRNLQNSQNPISVPEMAHSDSTTKHFENQSPPAYDITAGKLYWKRMHKKTTSELSSRDYALWKLEGRNRSRRIDDWDGFVTAIPGGASSSGNNEYNKSDDYNNSYDIESIGYRNSKGSVKSNILPAKRGSNWGENWL
ncbi:growth factor receptor domain-containing protein [Gigaspora margarita]|uniref:Growth factor receptor domain-containing protein n=1 Tax=Gigaspora margarita TaxID=4874 RepID=A0A8H4ALV9_GIGMA|nr:growth factor receptor domain-containing protein [Gigaspora margarita]